MAGSSSSQPTVCASRKARSISPSRHQHVDHGEGERRIAAGEGLEVNIGLLGGGVADWIDDDHRAGRFLEPLLVLVRRGGRGVRAPDDDASARPSRCADRSRSPRCRWHSRAPHDRPCCRPCRAPPRGRRAGRGSAWGNCSRSASRCRCSARARSCRRRRLSAISLKRVAIAPMASSHETGSKRPFPLAPARLSGVCSLHLRVAEDAVVRERALAAERAPAHRVVRVAEYAGDRAAPLDGDDAAGVVAIARAGGLEDFLLAWHGGLRGPVFSLNVARPVNGAGTPC